MYIINVELCLRYTPPCFSLKVYYRSLHVLHTFDIQLEFGHPFGNFIPPVASFAHVIKDLTLASDMHCSPSCISDSIINSISCF